MFTLEAVLGFPGVPEPAGNRLLGFGYIGLAALRQR
jgi:hypothetical protein